MILCRNTFDNLAYNDPWALYWMIATVNMPSHFVADAIESLCYVQADQSIELKIAIKKLVVYMLRHPNIGVHESCMNGMWHFDFNGDMIEPLENYLKNCTHNILKEIAKNTIEDIKYEIQYQTEQAKIFVDSATN